MSEEEPEIKPVNAVFIAGQVIGLALRCLPETYLQAAEFPALHPDYAKALRLLAEFWASLQPLVGL